MSQNKRKRTRFSVTRPILKAKSGFKTKSAAPQSFELELLTNKEKNHIIKGFFNGEQIISARKPGFYGQTTASTTGAIKSGAFEFIKHGYITIKESGSTIRSAEKLVVLEKGILNIYEPKSMDENNKLPSVLQPELSLSLVELASIVYNKRGDKNFGLVFHKTTETESISSGSKLRRKSKVNSSNLIGSTKSYAFKFKKSETTEVWLAAILTEVKNQAKIIEYKLDKLIRKATVNDDNNIIIEGLLRQTVDLYQLSLGKYHKNTALAQDKLGKFLSRSGRDEVEAKIWCKSAQITSKIVKETELMEFGDYILKKTKLIKSKKALNQIQYQTEAIYRLKAYKEKVVSMRTEAQKWKARAILYGFGDKKARKAPLKKLSFTQPRERTNPVAKLTEEVKVKKVEEFKIIEKKTEEKKVKRIESSSSHLSMSTKEDEIVEKKKKNKKALPSVLETDGESEVQTEIESKYSVTESDVEPIEDEKTEKFNFKFYLNRRTKKRKNKKEKKKKTTLTVVKPIVNLETTEAKIESLETTTSLMREMLNKTEEKDKNKHKKANDSKKLVLLERINVNTKNDDIKIEMVHLKNAFEELKTGKNRVESMTFKPIIKPKLNPVDKNKETKPACYLMLSPANKGTLYMRWSKRDLRQHSLIKFEPPNPDKIPSYMYRIKSGLAIPKRDELIKNVHSSQKRIFLGVNLFLKQSSKYNAETTIFGENINFRIFGYIEEDGSIEEVKLNESVSCLPNYYDAVVTLSGVSTTFDGIKYSSKAQFLSRGKKQGASIAFK